MKAKSNGKPGSAKGETAQGCQARPKFKRDPAMEALLEKLQTAKGETAKVDESETDEDNVEFLFADKYRRKESEEVSEWEGFSDDDGEAMDVELSQPFPLKVGTSASTINTGAQDHPKAATVDGCESLCAIARNYWPRS